MSATQNKVICVKTVGMDSRKQAVFRMAFKMHTMQRYELAEDAIGMKPDLAIVDMDCVDGNLLWENHGSENPDLPTLIVSMISLPDAPVPVLVKPVRIETLFPLLRQVLSERTTPGRQNPPQSPPQSPPLQVVQNAQPELASQTVPSSVNAPSSQPAMQKMPEQVGRFDPTRGLLGTLQEILQAKRPSMVMIANQNSLIVFPEQERVMVLQDLTQLKNACENEGVIITTRALQKEDKPDNRNIVVSNFVGLLWQVAIWTSRGRLPDGIPVHAPVKLKYWPNLTRMAPIPNALRMAAFLVRSPSSLPVAVRMLNVPPANLFDFLSAAYSIGLLDVIESRREAAETPPVEPVLVKDEAKGGMLSRLLRRIVGL